MVPLPLGLLRVENALLITPQNETLSITNTTVEVYEDKLMRRLLRGKGLIHNLSMVRLLEKNETFDILLDFGDEILFYLKEPLIQVGKVFDKNVYSTLHFSIGKEIRETSPAEVKAFAGLSKI